MMFLDPKGKEVEVWEIGSEPQPDWVREAFAIQAFQWLDDNLRILMPILQRNWLFKGDCWGYGIYQIGKKGDVIDRTNGKLLSQRAFQTKYTVK
ncbi:hypothetical protein [Streptococcus oriscaviae]|nr:hypothetical protein [Streptococcus oriscaviae]